MKKILTALITPFDENGNVDDTALICLVKDQIKKGVDGFVTVSYTHLDVYKRQTKNRYCTPIVKTL